MQQGATDREYQLSSVDQAQMDFWVNQLRKCYREMTAIAMGTIPGGEEPDVEFNRPPGEQEVGGVAEWMRDQDVVWPWVEGMEWCYRKDGGQVVIRPSRKEEG